MAVCKKQHEESKLSVIAFVEKLSTKSGTGSTGRPYTLYSLKLQDKDGEMLAGYYQCGFDAPPCKDGDYIKLDATPKGDNWEVVKGSIKVSKNPPAKPAAPAQEKSAGKSEGYNSPDRQNSIVYQSSRKDAVETVALLLEHGALKLVKADTKAGAASRFDLITAAIDKVTVAYFNDVTTLRKLESVADTVVDLSGDGELPDADEEEVESDDFDDLPPAGDDDFGDDDEFE